MADSQRKTANLWSFGNVSIAVGERLKTFDISLPSNTYTVKAKYSSTNTGSVTIGIYDENEQIHTYNTTQIDGTVSCSYTGIITAIGLYTAGGYSPSASYSADFTEVMLNTGSQPLPYEPYGWVHSLRKLGTSTDTLTTLPADLYADGNSATVGLKGNMSQTGTPTPTTPIQPQECGDMSSNLCNQTPYKLNYYINENGVETQFDGFDIYKVTAMAQTKYTLSLNTSLSGSTVRIHSYSNGSWMEQTTTSTLASLPVTFTTPQGCDEVRFSITHNAQNHIMLNVGETALPYQPYGYKIPILSNSTTTPVYLGEVQTTRKIKKLVLTGEENFQLHSSIANLFTLTTVTDYLFEEKVISMCTHYRGGVNTGATSALDGTVRFYYGSAAQTRIFYVKDTNFSTAADFKTYLQQQYAAGTPVCVWYVLATPTTGIVNEPIRKIGDYADSITGVTVPTTTGKDTFDVQTTLKPSEVSLVYTGWHDAMVKEWDGSEWQDEQPVSLLSASSRPTLTESTPDIMDITEPEEEKE